MAPKEKAKKDDAAKAKGTDDKKKKQEVEKPAADASKEEKSPESKLSLLRPNRRLIFFIGFVSFCAWLLVNFDPCKPQGKKGKQDCGWEGVSPLNCITTACFQKSQPVQKHSVTLKSRKGEQLGLSVSEGKDAKYVTVDSISAGLVKEHNDALEPDSEERILPGDSIRKIGDAKGKKLSKAVAAAQSDGSVAIELGRSNLPTWLLWLHNPAEMSFIEKALTSKGFERWSRSFGMLGGGGFSCWFLSGYPLTSLPMYMGISTLTAWQTTRCCHDEKVGAGQPHCFFGGAKLEVVVKKAWTKTRDLALKVKDDPKSYIDWLLLRK